MNKISKFFTNLQRNLRIWFGMTKLRIVEETKTENNTKSSVMPEADAEKQAEINKVVKDFGFQRRNNLVAEFEDRGYIDRKYSKRVSELESDEDDMLLADDIEFLKNKEGVYKPNTTQYGKQ